MNLIFTIIILGGGQSKAHSLENRLPPLLFSNIKEVDKYIKGTSKNY